MNRKSALVVEFLHVLYERSCHEDHADGVGDDHQSVEDIGDVPGDIECGDAADECHCGEQDPVEERDLCASCQILKSFLAVVLPAQDG